MTTKPDEGSAEEEAAESPKEEAAEQAKDGITIPEEFQQEVHGLMKKATSKHHLSHIRDRVYAKEDEMRQAEQKKDKGSKSKGPTGTMEVEPSIEG